MRWTKKEFYFFLSVITLLFIAANIVSYFAITKYVGASLYSGKPYLEIKNSFIKKSAEGVDGQHFIHPFFGTSNADWEVYDSDKSSEPLFHGVSSTARADSIKVLVLGGSVATHLSSGMPGVKENILASSLNTYFNTDRFVVYNAAFGGGKQPQQYFKYLYLDLLGFTPDVVINMDGFNEIALSIGENKSIGNPAIFPRSFSLQVNTVGADRSCAELNNRLLAMDSKIPLVEFAAWVYVRNCHSKITGVATQSWWLKSMRIDERTDFVKQAISIWRDSSNSLNEVLSSKKIDYLHVLQPNQYVQGSKNFTDTEKTFATVSSVWGESVKNYYPLLTGEGLTTKNFRDQRTIFKDTAETVYSDSCCHFNQKGMSMIVNDLIIHNRDVFERLLTTHREDVI